MITVGVAFAIFSAFMMAILLWSIMVIGSIVSDEHVVKHQQIPTQTKGTHEARLATFDRKSFKSTGS